MVSVCKGPGENERNKIDRENKKKKGFEDTNYMLPVDITKGNYNHRQLRLTHVHTHTHDTLSL